jgi:hypothetical protein
MDVICQKIISYRSVASPGETVARAILRIPTQLTRLLGRVESGAGRNWIGGRHACEWTSNRTERCQLYQLRRCGRVKRLNPRRVKIHRSYTVEEAAMLFRVHKNTVRTWLKSGLQPIDSRRPILMLGRQLARFLHARRERKRQRCRPGQLFCFRCRAPRTSAAHRADYLPITTSSGNLRGVCCDCGTRMYRRVSLRKLATAVGDLQVALPQVQQRLVETTQPSVNCDLEREPDAQRRK